MDGRIDEIREALIKLRAFAKSFDCDYQDECTPGDDDMCQSCKHVYIADQALAALSAIDTKAIRRDDEAVAKTLQYLNAEMDKRDVHDDAIRREALQKVAAEIKDFHSEITWDDYEEGYKDGTENALAIVDAAIVATDTATAIIGTEPAQDDGEPDATATEQGFSDKWCAYWKDFWLKFNYPVIPESSRPKNWDTANDIYEIVDKIREQVGWAEDEEFKLSGSKAVELIEGYVKCRLEEDKE